MKSKVIKRLVLMIAMILVLNRANAQETGIQFENLRSWAAVLIKAKAENKYIFVDCFATWCGPCKFMDQNVFKKKAAGDYFNEHFLNVRVQMDRTQKDGPEVKNWYTDAADIKKQYDVESYPCYLFFSPDGLVVHRISGAIEKPADFIAEASKALDPAKQYYTMIAYEQDFKNDSVTLFRLYQNAKTLRDYKNQVLIGHDYLNSIKSPFSKQNILVINALINLDKSYTDEGRKFLLENAVRINQLMGNRDFVTGQVSFEIYEKKLLPLFVKESPRIDWQVITMDLTRKYAVLGNGLMGFMDSYFAESVDHEIKLLFTSQDDPIRNWQMLSDSLQRRFVNYDKLDMLFLLKKADYLAGHKLWAECTQTTCELLKKHGSQLSDENINNLSWDYLFSHSASKKELEEGIKWQKIILERPEKNSIYSNWLDTYANLLYKAGKKQEALTWENKAVKEAVRGKHSNADDLKKNLDKMSKGQPTWDNSAR